MFWRLKVCFYRLLICRRAKRDAQSGVYQPEVQVARLLGPDPRVVPRDMRLRVAEYLELEADLEELRANLVLLRHRLSPYPAIPWLVLALVVLAGAQSLALVAVLSAAGSGHPVLSATVLTATLFGLTHLFADQFRRARTRAIFRDAGVFAGYVALAMALVVPIIPEAGLHSVRLEPTARVLIRATALLAVPWFATPVIRGIITSWPLWRRLRRLKRELRTLKRQRRHLHRLDNGRDRRIRRFSYAWRMLTATYEAVWRAERARAEDDSGSTQQVTTIQPET